MVYKIVEEYKKDYIRIYKCNYTRDEIIEYIKNGEVIEIRVYVLKLATKGIYKKRNE